MCTKWGLTVSLFVSRYLIIYDPLFISGFQFASLPFGYRNWLFIDGYIPAFCFWQLNYFIFRFENLLHHDFELVSFAGSWVARFVCSFFISACMYICFVHGECEFVCSWASWKIFMLSSGCFDALLADPFYNKVFRPNFMGFTKQIYDVSSAIFLFLLFI